LRKKESPLFGVFSLDRFAPLSYSTTHPNAGPNGENKYCLLHWPIADIAPGVYICHDLKIYVKPAAGDFGLRILD
jgi:hypothetical protein